MDWGLPNYYLALDTWTSIGGRTIADLRSGTNNFAKTPDKSELIFISIGGTV